MPPRILALMRKLNPNLTELRNHATHWQLPSAAYFLTWRVRADTPALTPIERDAVSASVTFFHRQRYQLYAYVVMDDHAHAILRPQGEYSLSRTMQTLKSYTTRELWRLGIRQGAVWQKDYFDRIIRNENDMLEKMQYILNNPFKRWPELSEYKWAEWFALDNIKQ